MKLTEALSGGTQSSRWMPTQSTRKLSPRTTFWELLLLLALQLFDLQGHQFPLRTDFRNLAPAFRSLLTTYPTNFQGQSFRRVVLDLEEGSLAL